VAEGPHYIGAFDVGQRSYDLHHRHAPCHHDDSTR
jgi:hypothetical protein